ncbi:uncharacterized protein LOC119191816 [Manduca sexta]|uniref:Uncharacterized protein n=1 Tax=Manduca sexta TaxID=7130 RepID=A0A921ZLW7_MANSE|nr:uncharacterized protein LOC119191653 [Manduca sexta]XP_037301580.1 uncharacterized protein LOC119191816 [Manduca sexta]KAG6460362.1 hypothetical protein O3G_MSEX011934 [Manduca sexta]KAG6465025.1 hypothetical protein O3G_MSEX014885 [Manduca sexta]
MIRLLIRLSLVLLVSYQLATPCEAIRGYGIPGIPGMPGSPGYSRGYKTPMQPKTFSGTSPGLASQPATRRGLGISAWGIVILIVSLILAGMGFYYFSICYPSICMNRNKYNMMSMPAMV